MTLNQKGMGSTGDAAAILGCSTSSIRKLIEHGQLKNVVRQSNLSYMLDLNEVRKLRRQQAVVHESLPQGTHEGKPDYEERDRLADQFVKDLVIRMGKINRGEIPLPKVY